jgi:NAD(P)-dependent dehydrogenase (short-subunit alcohol dehydrogenase family)
METARKTVIVTGATGGIGSALVQYFLENGYEVIGACRRPERLPQHPHLSGLKLDLSSMASVAAAAESLRGVRIFGLINNAGIMPLRATTITVDGYEQTYQVNYLATVDFTRRLLPQVEDGGAVVFTTSVTRRLPFAKNSAAERASAAQNPVSRFANYGRTKWLLAQTTQQMAEELAPRRIRVNAADPGVVDTGIITLGWKWIDRLSDAIFRPLISTPEKGARAAINAFSASASGRVFTPAD